MQNMSEYAEKLEIIKVLKVLKAMCNHGVNVILIRVNALGISWDRVSSIVFA